MWLFTIIEIKLKLKRAKDTKSQPYFCRILLYSVLHVSAGMCKCYSFKYFVVHGCCFYIKSKYVAQLFPPPLSLSLRSFEFLYRSWILIISHETPVSRNPHNSSNWDCRITRQLGYKRTFCQNLLSTKNCFSFFYYKNLCLNVGLLRICELYSVFCKILCQWSTTNCSFLSDIEILPIIQFVNEDVSNEMSRNIIFRGTY
jgi:hypothetical protein